MLFRSSSRGSSRERWIRVALFGAAAFPAAIAIAALNASWYGAPWRSGYGADIFSTGNILPNLARYPVWLWRSQSPLILFALVPFLPRFRGDASRPAARLCAAMFIATLLSYLLYYYFETWSFVRFLLPAIPALLVLMATGLVAVGRRLPRPWGHVAVAFVTIVLLVYTTRFSIGQGMFGPLKDGERRYADVGAYIHQALPADAVVFSVQQSGSVRFYGGRVTVRWDLIDRDWTGRAAGEIERLGWHPYMVIEDFELPQMRDWFGLAPDAQIPWPLVARMRAHGGVSVLDMATQRAAGTVPVSLESGGAPLCGEHQPLTIQRK